jgi:site-specific DNA-methyltransferase (adenine-specific)
MNDHVIGAGEMVDNASVTPLLPAITTAARGLVGAWRVNGVYNASAVDLLLGLPDKSIRLVFIDPPYGNNNGVDDLAAARARDKVKGGRQSGEIEAIANDDRTSWETLMQSVLPQLNRVLMDDGACCICVNGGGVELTFAHLMLWVEQHMKFFHAVVWDKSKRGNGMGWRYRRNYEFVMVAHKRGGRLAWNETRGARPNVVNYAPTTNQFHPTEKPVGLVEEFILNHTNAGDTVLDCFCGSGTTGVAAVRTGRNYILADLAAHHVVTAQKRLADGVTVDMFAAGAAS